MTILVTGAAGFIGFHTCKALVARGETVLGLDNVNGYYDVDLKQARLEQLLSQKNFTFVEMDISDNDALERAVSGQKIHAVLHLAAQAGVRYSIENPKVYADTNLQGFFNVLEYARNSGVANVVYASSSSIYGGNTKMPFAEDDVTDTPVSFYAATKKSNELMAHSYAHLYGISLTGLRFFTVYGEWGRPDMAYWIFSEKLRRNEPVQIFNNGDMSRDFTYIDDIVTGVIAAIDRPASALGLDVPHRVYNLGNDKPEKLMDLVGCIEKAFGQELIKEFQPMQLGDVERTWADISRARKELGFNPHTSLEEGIERFASWFKFWKMR
ncbi:SDR family NAD(P)-dependent oxidoreductase [Hirschia baltica]|uniref:NAD-dependent epimerase/dehydratase n=1 Tax=Hirschia baltica (strain ATCC 49814 / DSM 5838 / IFAM 1418) TaxID=582402 RepID=C6XK50_HIRBI|nr:SDR family NAD(P)-dependent oxidoreductase [Hirschia baltica]ACT59495.1 NAD-dependent epimerase/dehydratase [Hirschia baltica ATCC 49814]